MENKTRPAQKQQTQPGKESVMEPAPQTKAKGYKAAGKLQDKVAIVTGGDSGIGRAVAVAFAKEGADLAIIYLNEHDDAKATQKLVEAQHRRCQLIPIDVGEEELCEQAVADVAEMFGHIDILVNNAAEQHPQPSILEITSEQLERTFRTNIFGYFYMTKAALPHMREGSVIINTTSVTAYRGSPTLLDYSSTKGAIVSFTRSLSLNLAKQKIRVNGVAPGPVWTPLIPSTFPEEKVERFGADVPMQRPGEGDEIAPCYVFLASDDSSFMSGQVLHPNGGEIING